MDLRGLLDLDYLDYLACLVLHALRAPVRYDGVRGRVHETLVVDIGDTDIPAEGLG